MIGIRDVWKMFGVIVVTFCAAFVCTLFLNYNADLASIESFVSAGEARAFYDAQYLTGIVVCCLSGGCLAATSAVLLAFYIRHYINAHGKELGILKALGWSDLRIAGRFWLFGLSVLIGCAAGVASSFAPMPFFYSLQNEGALLPDVAVGFHAELLCLIVLLPFAVFTAFSVLYAGHRLHRPVLCLLKECPPEKRGKIRREGKERPFLTEVCLTTLSSGKSLVFFISLAAFCWSAMTQMSFAMKDLSSVLMGVMIAMIGIILAFTVLYIAIKSVVKANAKSVALMRAFGWLPAECGNAVLGGYRPFVWLGFLLGTLYQYGLLKLMVLVVFASLDFVPDYSFDFLAFGVSLAAFLAIYEFAMLFSARRLCRTSLKTIMLD